MDIFFAFIWKVNKFTIGWKDSKDKWIFWVKLFIMCEYFEWNYSSLVNILSEIIHLVWIFWVKLFILCEYFGWNYSSCVNILSEIIHLVWIFWMKLFILCGHLASHLSLPEFLMFIILFYFPWRFIFIISKSGQILYNN